MGEMKPTRGPWELWGDANPSQVISSPAGFVAQTLGSNDEANARLIAEAGTVHHETGLTPCQLAERVKEMEVALHDAEEYISGHTPTNSWGLLDRREEADRCATLEKVRSALSKSLPNTVAETPT